MTQRIDRSSLRLPLPGTCPKRAAQFMFGCGSTHNGGTAGRAVYLVLDASRTPAPEIGQRCGQHFFSHDLNYERFLKQRHRCSQPWLRMKPPRHRAPCAGMPILPTTWMRIRTTFLNAVSGTTAHSIQEADMCAKAEQHYARGNLFIVFVSTIMAHRLVRHSTQAVISLAGSATVRHANFDEHLDPITNLATIFTLPRRNQSCGYG